MASEPVRESESNRHGDRERIISEAKLGDIQERTKEGMGEKGKKEERREEEGRERERKVAGPVALERCPRHLRTPTMKHTHINGDFDRITSTS